MLKKKGSAMGGGKFEFANETLLDDRLKQRNEVYHNIIRLVKNHIVSVCMEVQKDNSDLVTHEGLYDVILKELIYCRHKDIDIFVTTAPQSLRGGE